MAANPDPKPGRWILPLVILGMVAFTYFFVSSLPEGSPTTTLALGSTTTTLEGTGTTQPGTATTAAPTSPQAYLDELDAVNAELQLLATEMVTVNDGFDAEPRTVEFDDAEARLEALSTNTQTLADRVRALTPPAGLEANHQALVTAIDFCAGAAQDALAGLRSTDEGQQRSDAVNAYTTSAAGFDTEVQNAKNAAGTTPDA